MEHILPHLAGPGAPEAARPELDQLTLSSLPGLYCTETMLDITLDTCSKSFLKVHISLSGQIPHLPHLPFFTLTTNNEHFDTP